MFGCYHAMHAAYCPSQSFMLGALASWCRGAGGELLVSQYMLLTYPSRPTVWMLPLRKPVADATGVMRLGYWQQVRFR